MSRDNRRKNNTESPAIINVALKSLKISEARIMVFSITAIHNMFCGL